jgi:hypothetical protein
VAPLESFQNIKCVPEVRIKEIVSNIVAVFFYKLTVNQFKLNIKSSDCTNIAPEVRGTCRMELWRGDCM